MNRLATIVALTLQEAARKRVLLASLLLGAAFVALDAVGFHFIVQGFHGHIGALAQAQARFTYATFTLAGLYAVHVLGGMAAGTVQVGGTLDASAPKCGDGGTPDL